MTSDGSEIGGADLDEVLMARVAEGNPVAFETLVRRNMRRALAVAQGVVGDIDDANEIAQEAFMRVWQHAARWNPDKARFTTWLHRIVVNLCLDRRRKPAMLPIDAAGDPPEEREAVTEEIARDEQRRAVARALETIPERQRAAVVLFYFEGHSGKESAEILGTSLAAFEQLLLRARRAVKAALARQEISARGGMS